MISTSYSYNRKNIIRKHLFKVYFYFLSLAHVLPVIIEQEGFLICTAAHCHGLIRIFWHLF